MGLVIEDHRLNDWSLELRRESVVVYCPRVVCYEDGLLEMDYEDVKFMQAVLDIVREKLSQTTDDIKKEIGVDNG